MGNKYLCVHTDTQVEIIEIDKPGKGSLTFGVGGPVAALVVKELCDEVNELHAELARLQRIEAAARELMEAENRTNYESFRARYGAIRQGVEMLAAALDKD